ncbi:MAG TPA: GTPase domain-containing protein, partial [Propioniciclava tarda]|nr:GTPase domain-containing protein [Propioniciclava tarda]
MSTATLVESLTQLRQALAGIRLPLTLPGSAEADKSAREMVAQLDDYILPRLDRLDAPLLAVIGGSTGAGKSTLVNSLIGRVVSRPGVIRPTTRSPVLVHNPADLDFFSSDRVLPGLARSFDQANDSSTLQLVAEPTLPQGLALLDAPDVDSVVSENRALASQLLAAADLWLFVTTAARYADAVPWEYLQAAAERSAAVAVVLQRVPPAAMHEVPSHLGRLMLERGLGNSPLFAVPETTTDAAGLLPDAAVTPIRDWLATLAADKASRQAVVMQTLDGAIGSLTARTPAVVEALQSQSSSTAQLWSDAKASYAEASRTMAVQTADGTLLRGEVLSRWQDFVGTGEFMRG